MRLRIATNFSCLAIAAFCLSSSLGFADTAEDPWGLNGIHSVNVIIKAHPTFPGLQERLQNIVATRLRDAGLTVPDGGLIQKNAFLPFLEVTIGILTNEKRSLGMYAVSVDVSFAQIVFLPAFPLKQSFLGATTDRARVRQGTRPHVAATWTQSSLHLFGLDVAEAAIVDQVKETTDLFISAYLAANSPPQRPSKR